MMYVCRFNKKGGEKDILPLTFCSRNDRFEWRWKGLLTPRPLYNLDHLYARRNAPVLIVEGEKAADAAAKLYPDFVVTTWPHGGKAVNKSDWGPLARRNVILWPDADTPGHDAMKDVARCLPGIAIASVRQVTLPQDVPEKWDVADAAEEIKAGTRELDAVLSLVVNASEQNVTDDTGTNEADTGKGGNKRRGKSYDDYLRAVGDIELWHTSTKEAWATVASGAGLRNFRIDDPSFATWLDFSCYRNGLGVPSREMRSSLIATIKARAIHEGPEHKLYLRVAGSLDSTVYIDLGRDDGKAVEINSNGWRVIGCPPVKFRRTAIMNPLPDPDAEGSVDELWSWINCKSDDDNMLILVFILKAVTPKHPYPVLALSGSPGASKSVTSQIIRRFIDPNEIPLVAAPDRAGDFAAVLENSHLLVFDNIEKIPVWLSNSLCGMATGAGVVQRRLHSNTELTLIKGGRPSILNGIGDLMTRGDLADRGIIVNLEPPPRRRPEYLKTNDTPAFWDEFEVAQPRIFGGLCGVFSAAMKAYNDGVKAPGEDFRLGDLGVWGEAVSVAMGWPAGAFEAAYIENRRVSADVALEDSFIWKHLEALFPVGGKKWSGSATELQEKVVLQIDSTSARKKFETLKPSVIGTELKRIMGVLNKAGWEIYKDRKGKDRAWHITAPESED